jgi:hypothetical protein
VSAWRKTTLFSLVLYLIEKTFVIVTQNNISVRTIFEALERNLAKFTNYGDKINITKNIYSESALRIEIENWPKLSILNSSNFWELVL